MFSLQIYKVLMCKDKIIKQKSKERNLTINILSIKEVQ